MVIIRSFLFAFFSLISFSLVFADATGTSLSFFDQYISVQNKFSTISNEISSGSLVGSSDMSSLLACMAIPVPSNNETYISILSQLKTDFDYYFDKTVSSGAVGSSSQLVRLAFYSNSLDSLRVSLNKDRLDRETIMKNLVFQNQSLFDQLSSDKILLDSILASYDTWSQKIIEHRVLYGYDISQYQSITDNYKTILQQKINTSLSEIHGQFLKKNSNLSGFSDYATIQKAEYLRQFSHEVDSFFQKQIGNTTNVDLNQEYQKEIESIKTTFYNGSDLQCGLLTSLNQQKRIYYANLLVNILSQQKILDNSILSGNSNNATGSSTTTLFAAGSQSLKDLNDRYSIVHQKYQNLYINTLTSQKSLLTKVARSEEATINEFLKILTQYKTTTGEEKSNIKLSLMGQINRFEKETIVSVRAVKALDKIKSSLGLSSSLTKKRILRKNLKK